MASAVVSKFKAIYNGAISAFNFITSIPAKFTAFKNTVLQTIEGVKTGIKTKIDAIKGFFTGLILKIPKPSLPSLPKFSLKTSSKTILGHTITYPVGFDVSWHAKNYDALGLYTSPTVLSGMNGYVGVGDRGSYKGGELYGSAQDATRVIENAVNRGLSDMLNYDRLGDTIAKAMSKMDMSIVLNDREVGRALS